MKVVTKGDGAHRLTLEFHGEPRGATFGKRAIRMVRDATTPKPIVADFKYGKTLTVKYEPEKIKIFGAKNKKPRAAKRKP